MTKREDVDALPESVRSTAIWLENGEVMWPFHSARQAVDALTAAGLVVLGVDARERDDRGLVTEVPLTSWNDTSDATGGHALALVAIDRAEESTGWTAPNLLLTW